MCVVDKDTCNVCVAKRESVENSPSHIPKNILDLHMKEKNLHAYTVPRATRACVVQI